MVTSSFEPFLGCLLTWHYLLPAFKFYSAATANEISCLQMGQLKSGHLASKQSFVQVASCLCRVSSCWLGCWVDIMIKADVRSRQEIFVLAKNKKYDSFSDVGEIRVYRRADFQSGSRVLKKVF